MSLVNDNWNSGDPYEYFMGRWSKQLAPLFLDWLNAQPDESWLDLGCGTGALSEAIHLLQRPSWLTCLDASPAFIDQVAKKAWPDTDYLVGIAQQIPVQDQSYDLVVSALAFNFFDDLAAALEEMKRVLKPEGTIAAYVWDYAGEMEFLRIFWHTVVELDPAAAPLDEGNRFPICNPTRLEEAFHAVALHQIQSGYLVMTTRFMHFDDYWNPFLGGQGPAPSYLGSLSPVQQTRLREAIREKLPVESDGSIQLIARAIAIRGNL